MFDMSDIDDISALWGGQHENRLHPDRLPSRPAFARQPRPDVPSPDAGRLDAMERRWREVLERLIERIDTIEQEQSGGRLHDQRVTALEDQVQQRMVRLDAVERQFARLQEAFQGQLALIVSQAVDAATARVVAVEEELNDRLDAIDAAAARVTAETARVASLVPSAASALAPLRSDLAALQTRVNALTEAVGQLAGSGKSARGAQSSVKVPRPAPSARVVPGEPRRLPGPKG